MTDKMSETNRQKQIEASWLDHSSGGYQGQAMVRRQWLLHHLELQKYACAYCSVTLIIGKLEGLENQQATIDHVMASSCGGIDEIENTLVACARCNGNKGNQSLYEFLTSTLLRERIEMLFGCPDHLIVDGKPLVGS